ncbi:MAG: hypothetical protein R6T83_06200 [Salinibacter sp.]
MRTSLCWTLVGPILLVGGLLLGCDQVSAPPDRAPPTVADLNVTPDSVNAAALPPDLVSDSVAQVPLEVSAAASDPDGTIERVVFTFEPASVPAGAAFGELQPTEDGRYGREFSVTVPATRDEVYSLRVFAVDSDSLASNQVTGQFRFVPASE